MTYIKAGPYAPDLALDDPAVMQDVLNARPVADGWGPLPRLNVFTDALPAAWRGHTAILLPDGTRRVFAGTAGKLYSLNSNGTWTDVSGASYSLPPNEFWQFAVFGSRVIATQLGDPPQYFDIGVSTTFANLPGSPPSARYVKVIGDFVFLAHLSTSENSVQWSGINNSESWTPGSELGDIQAFPDGGEIMGIVEVPGGCIIPQREKFRTGTFNPASQYTFNFNVLNNSKGVSAPYCVAEIGQGDFVYLADDGFYRGVQALPIGNEIVDRTFYNNVDITLISSTVAAVDPFEKIVWFRYLDSNSIGQVIGYDWVLGRWCRSDANLTGIGTLITASLSLEDLDTLFPGGIDSVELSVDDRTLGFGAIGFSGFDANNRLGFFSGTAQEAVFEFGRFEHNPPARSFLRGARIVGDIPRPGDASFDDYDDIIDDLTGSVDNYQKSRYEVSVKTFDFHEGADAASYSDGSTPHMRTGVCPFRKSGRLHQYKVKVFGGTNWKTFQGIRPDVIAEGDQ